MASDKLQVAKLLTLNSELAIVLSVSHFLQRRKSFFKICDYVIDMLGAYRQPDRVAMNILILQLLIRKLRMRRCRRMNDERFDVGNVCEQ